MTVVADTSVVLNLCWLRQENLLEAIYEKVLAPERVRTEFERKVVSDPRFTGLCFPTFIVVAGPTLIPPVLAENPDLDVGEIATLALALERGVVDVLIDEQLGRATALSLGLHVSGLLGVLIEAKHRSLIFEIRPLLVDLIAGARFWIRPELRDRVLRCVGERPGN